MRPTESVATSLRPEPHQPLPEQRKNRLKLIPAKTKNLALGVIQTFVGHMSARMVRHYTHVSSGAARKAVELLDSDPILTPSAEEKVYRA